ncbi:MAG: NAD(P)-dependent oxidoreductase [Deltaproteobacteria bacterium]|nr:NAD(P)-dependent oxidoreductase [Deltaproteobacteria bacterium]
MANQLGFIGLGAMGGRMVATLAKAGQPVIVFDINAGAVRSAIAHAGVSAAQSSAELAGKCAVLFTCLPNNEIVHEVYLGNQGIAQGGRAGLITCDCSTVSPDLTKELHTTLAARQIRHLDTPMLGSTPQAETGQIFFIVGGDEENLPAIAPYLEIMGRMHRYVGGPGAGNWIKLVHNVLGAVNSVAVAEALAVCKKANVDLEHFYQVVKNGGGMAYSTYFDRRVPTIKEGKFDPTFTLDLMNKDVGLANQIADQVGVPVPIWKETQATYREAMENGWGREDFSAVTQVIEKRIGQKISGK